MTGPTSSSLRVIVLEDDPLDYELVVERLRADGGRDFQVTHAKDATSFERALREGLPDLILSDYSLPGYDGMAALAAARQRYPDVPFVFVTGALGEDLALETLRRGATDYVLKQRLDRLWPAAQRALKESEDRLQRRRAEAERDQLLLREREAREEAEAANRMKDEFLAMVSHELRTPLNAMLGWLRLLRTGMLSDEKARAMETVERNANIQAKLVEDLLEVSRIVTGKIRLEMEPVDLGGVITSAVESLWPLAKNKGVHIQVHSDEDVETMTGDAQRLQQVIWNLVSNAVKFTPGGGNVNVRLERAASGVRVVVTDDGEGIAPDFLPHVFDRFRQEDGGRSRRHGGLGLGLAIVRHLVELHGGEVSADSAGPNRGATFVVRFGSTGTRAAEPPELAAPALKSPTSGDQPADPTLLRGVDVLVVDDEIDARDLLVTALEQWGARVRTAASAAGALAAIDEHPPHVMVSDIGMPGEDGYELVRQVRARATLGQRAIATVALTAYVRYEDRLQAVEAGFEQHVAKPVEPAHLAATIARITGRGPLGAQD